jgi:hypothetical protein
VHTRGWVIVGADAFGRLNSVPDTNVEVTENSSRDQVPEHGAAQRQRTHRAVPARRLESNCGTRDDSRVAARPLEKSDPLLDLPLVTFFRCASDSRAY